MPVHSDDCLFGDLQFLDEEYDGDGVEGRDECDGEVVPAGVGAAAAAAGS